MTMSDRGIHPDLLDEVLAEREAPPADAPAGRGRSRRVASTVATDEPAAPVGEAPPAAPPIEADDAAPQEQTPASEPETSWFDQVREAKDPTEALRLLAKNLPYDELEKDEVISGLVGRIGDRRARQLLEQQARAAAEQRKMEAAANNDLYTLGEITQQEMQAPLQQRQQAESAQPFFEGVVQFQRTLPEAIQREVSGKAFGEGKSYAEGVAEYMAFVVDRAAKLERAKIESAVRKSVMSELNGDEPVPERDSGTPGRVREVTDEQIANMSLAEYDALFDENGRPKPGVRHRSTRGVSVRSQ